MLTDELFKCPNCGVLPQASTQIQSKNERGETCFPWHRVLCGHCGREGRFVCRGDTVACRVQNGVCHFHRCDIVVG